jgi:hypothetical protein
VRQDAPFSLLIITAAGIVIANVVVAQAVMQMVAPGDGFRLGIAVMIALSVATLGCAAYAVRGWRAYMRGDVNRTPEPPAPPRDREGEAR